jgi:UDP-N-acetyl-2-amino-2-deoxyglucuronate dehydrogenase
MSEPLGVVLVGCGVIGRAHADAVLAHPELRLAALVDAIPAAADALADALVADHGIPRPTVAASLATALGTPSDLVAICVPSGLHITVAAEAIAAGRHVVIEKPLDVDLARGRELVRLAHDAAARGLVVSVISQHRFDPSSVVLHDAIRAGRLGRLTSGVASVPWWRSQEYYDSGAWRGTWELDGGGALMNQGVHTLDLLLWMLGRPIEITARTALLAHERIEVEDVAAAVIVFESGALAVLHATTAAFPGGGVRLAVYGDGGTGVIEDDELMSLRTRDGDGDEPGASMGAASTAAADPAAVGEAGHLRQYRDLVDAIRSGRAPGVTVDDAMLALAVVRGVYIAASLGEPVAVDDVLAGIHDHVPVALERVTG